MTNIKNSIIKKEVDIINEVINNIVNLSDLKDIYKQIIYFSENDFHLKFLSHSMLDKINIDYYLFDYTARMSCQSKALDILENRNIDCSAFPKSFSETFSLLIESNSFNVINLLLSNKDFNYDLDLLIRRTHKDSNNELFKIIVQQKHIYNGLVNKNNYDAYEKKYGKLYIDFINKIEMTKKQININNF